MPLITVTCRPAWKPADNPADDTPKQAATYQLASQLPQLFADNYDRLQMDPCPTDGVQVVFAQFGPRDLNTPDGIWVKVEMAEVLEKTFIPAGAFGTCKVRDAEAEDKVKTELKQLIEPLRQALDPKPQIAVDIFWGPDHGWLDFGDVQLDW